MGLKNKLALGEWVRTNQRELDYGDNAPLIPQKRLPAVGELSETNLATSLDNLTDGFVPGGLLTGGERAITDTARISKFLVTGEGISFLGKQAALQRANPESLVSPRNRQWAPANLLAQIPSNLAGLHFRRDGLIDKDFESNFNYSPENGGLKYEQAFKDIILTNTEDTYDSTLKGLFTNLQLGQDPSIIKEYSGGANSFFGIGNTTIKKYSNVEKPNSDENEFNPDSYKYTEKVRARFTNPNNVYPMSEYEIGDPGKNPGIAYRAGVLNNGIDALNAEDIINRTNLTINNPSINDKDYINFRMALINTQNPLLDEVLLFRAFLESVNDNYTGTWNPYEYNGRAEKFHVYSGFDRDISFNFKIAAQSKAELRPLWYKLNYLVGSTAPEYVNRRMRGRYVRLTIGDWMYEIPGFFPSINLSWESRFPWELDETLNRHWPQKSEGIETDNRGNILASQHPMVLNVQCQFKPIHDFTPESRKDKPFIIRIKGIKQGEQVPESEINFTPQDLNI